ncbi:MAG TPA: hypothetical protein VMZ91_07725 [Candidatus Paceibacterota bacterium]|nr:hypothetical protein [Candidatus Paceibacterota bacterium]
MELNEILQADRDILSGQAKKFEISDYQNLDTEILRKSVYDFQESLDTRRAEIQHLSELPISDFKDLLEKNSVEFSEEFLDKDKRKDLVHDLFHQIYINKLFDERVSPLLEKMYPIDLEEPENIGNSLAELKRLKAQRVPIGGDDSIEHDNLMKVHANKVRDLFGLQPLELAYTAADLKILLQLDESPTDGTWSIGFNCQDFLNSLDKKSSTYQKYKDILTESLMSHNAEIKSLQHDKNFVYLLESNFKKLEKIPRQTILENSELKINPNFESWMLEIENLYYKLQNKQKAYDSVKNIKIDPRFTHIKGIIDKNFNRYCRK